MKVLFTVLFSAPKVDDIGPALLPGDTVVGRLFLPSGTSVRLARREAPMTEFERGHVRNLVADVQVNTADPESIEAATLLAPPGTS